MDITEPPADKSRTTAAEIAAIRGLLTQTKFAEALAAARALSARDPEGDARLSTAPISSEQNARQQMQVCTREFFAARGGWGVPNRDPIFIVGLPRSGSTLLEQILASHSQVEGTQELPNAKMIDARREPMACCFSNLKQLFANGQEFTYSVEDIARYYRTYLELMRHWDQMLPGWILRVQHEDVVDDLEGNVRRILTFCGLDFEPQCIEFHKTRRSVRTASSEQVRRPLNRDGLDQWSNFEPWLGSLRIALRAAADNYRS